MSRTIFLIASLLLAACLNSFAVELGEPLEDLGTIKELPDGSKLQLKIDDKRVFACFADKDGKIIESPADSVLMVIDDPGHKNDEIRILLKPEENGITLTSKRILYGPYVFRTRVIIRFTDDDPKTFPYLLLELDRNIE
ncbi:MAG: hypothetical protein AB3N63_11640 [Puniceicoccaceae bacterium]